MPATPREADERAPEDHAWIATETVATRLGGFKFRNGYPDGDAAQRLHESLLYNRAVEAYLAMMPLVSWYHVWKGVAEAGTGAANQMVIWETRMDAETLLLTGNCETVYGLASLDLKRDGPVVVDVPPMMLGGLNDLWQASTFDIGVTGIDKGKGGKFLLLPPGYDGKVPEGYFAATSRTFRASLGVRGFLVDGKPDKAVALMKATKIYPLKDAASPPAMSFVNGSHNAIDTLFSDDAAFFADLAEIVASEPEAIFSGLERFQLAALGMAKFRPFKPAKEQRVLLAEAARMGSAMARANSFASIDPERLVYPDRIWERAFLGGSASWNAQGYVNTDRRGAFAYIAIGMSPAMVEKHVGAGSQYLWTPRDGDNDFLDGARDYCLHLPPGIPVENFWSVVVYDSESRSMLKNAGAYPSVSTYTDPATNADGSIDIYFGPARPGAPGKNWIRTVPGKGWFALLRFYGPRQAFFDKSWKPGDIEKVD